VSACIFGVESYLASWENDSIAQLGVKAGVCVDPIHSWFDDLTTHLLLKHIFSK